MADIAVPAIIFLCIVILQVLRAKTPRAKIDTSPPEKFELGAASTFGTREVQQDYFGVKENQGALLMSLADGVGENGEIAAKLAVDTFRDLFDDANAINKPQYFFQRAANASHKRITNTLEERQGETSIVAAMLNGAQLFYMLIGDCRLTIFRDGDLIPISEGQTLDVLARKRHSKGQISRQKTLALLNNYLKYNLLGQDSFQEIELFSAPLTLKKNDLIVLMSAGIFETLRWVELENVLETKNPPQKMANDIINLVKESPLVDKANATILICRRK